MISVSILEPADIVQKTDWCRPLRLVTMSGGMSDYYSIESIGGNPENNVRWCRVNQVLGEMWYGKTAKEINASFDRFFGGYEFMRGDVPKSHQYGLTKSELSVEYAEYLKTTVMQVGKYREHTFYDIKHRDRNYFEWAISKSIIRTFEEFCREFES